MDVWTTAAYDHRQFGTLEKIYLPLVLKSYPVYTHTNRHSQAN